MASASFGMGFFEILLILLSGGGLMGTPPGARDAALLKAAPQQSLFYMEWASRGAGQPGAPGMDGFVADPEIQALFQVLEKGLTSPNPGAEEPEEQLQRRRDATLLVKLMTAHSGAAILYVEPPQGGNGLLNVPTPADIIARIRAGVILNCEADCRIILEAAGRLTQQKIPEQPKMLEIPTPAGQPIIVHRERDRLLLGFGRGTIERLVAGLKGEIPGLDANPRFQAGWKRVGIERVGCVGWLDIQGATDFVLQSMGPAGLLAQAVVRGAGADAVDCAVSGTGIVNGNVVQRTFVATGGRTDGVLLLAKNPSLRPEQLAHIPADSELVMAASLDLPTLVAGVRDLISKTNPLSVRVFDEATKELEAELGLSLVRDVYPAVGNAWTAFSSPSEGGMLGSGLIVAVEVRDAARAQVVFNRLMQLLEQSVASDHDSDSGATVELKRQEFQGQVIHYVSSSGVSFGVSPAMTPSFCLTRSHILFGIHPQALKAHLRLQGKPRPGFDSIARSKLPLGSEGLLFSAYFDGARATQTLSGLLPFLGQSLTDMALANGWEFDAFSIPSAAALVPYSGDVAMSVAQQKDGILIESRNPQIGIALLTVLGAARSMARPDYEILLDAKRQRRAPVDNNGGLGAAEGQVVPAAAEKPAPKAVDQPKETTAGAVSRRMTPLLLKALVPDDIQPMIPNEVFRRLAEPPSAETLKMREERRKMNEQRRRERLERRGSPPRP